MKEIKMGKAIVRVHGSMNQDKAKAVTADFLKKVEQRRKKVKSCQ